MKRLFDFSVALVGLILLLPVLAVVMLLVWLQDFKSPFYIAPRVGKNGRMFEMVKMRTMVKNADKSGVASTSAGDMRITLIGHLIRRLKFDEITQLYNVLLGQMSLVGPRPQVKQDVDLYTNIESRLLRVRPGITDFSSIVFADEGDILAPHEDADLAYNQLIRPWKSRLGLFYVDRQSFYVDIKLILLTVLNSIDRSATLRRVSEMLATLGAAPELTDIARRKAELFPHPPPGSDQVFSRGL